MSPDQDTRRKIDRCRVFADPNAPDGFRVHSFADDDPIECRDYVREKMGSPPWQPNKQHHHNPSNRFNGNSKTNGTRPVNSTQKAQQAGHVVQEMQRPCDLALPNRTPPDAAGKPKLLSGTMMVPRGMAMKPDDMSIAAMASPFGSRSRMPPIVVVRRSSTGIASAMGT